MQYPKNRQKLAIWAHRTSLSGYIFTSEAHIDNRKNLLSSNIYPACPYNTVNVGVLAAEICWRVWGTPCKFQRVSRLGSVTARHSSSGRQPKFAALNRDRHLYSAGRPSRWALAHILVTTTTTTDAAAVFCLCKTKRLCNRMIFFCESVHKVVDGLQWKFGNVSGLHFGVIWIGSASRNCFMQVMPSPTFGL